MGGHGNQSGAGGYRRGLKPHCTKRRLKCMSNSSLGHKEQKNQLHEIYTMHCSRDKDQNNKRLLTVCTGSNFQVGSISMRIGSN